CRRVKLRPGIVIGDRRAGIVVAVRDEGPAVVLAPDDLVYLVAAARAMFQIPELPARIELEAEQVTVAVAPYLAAHPVAIGERIPVRRRAVEIEAKHLAEIGAEVLRGCALHPLTRREEEILPVGRESDLVRIVPHAADRRLLAP